MPANKLGRVGTKSQLVRNTLVSSAQTSRIVATHAAAIGALEAQQTARSVVVVDLGVGANTVNTNLGRKARGCTLTPTAGASTSFAWSFAPSGTMQAIITIVGVAQPACALEFF